MTVRILPVALALVCCSVASMAHAQFQGSGNTGGLQGGLGGSTGGGLGTTAGGTQAGSGTGGMFGNRSLGSSLSGGARSMTGGRGVAGSTRNADAAGQITGSERFVRSNRQGQFVGSDGNDLRNIFSSMGGGQNRGQQGFGANRGQNQNANDGLNDQMQGQRRPIYRTQRVIGFQVREPVTATSMAAIGTRISRAVRVPGAKVDVMLQDRVAILQGTVPDAHARDLAAQLALLEPGVSQVQNDLQIAPAGTPTLAPAAGRPTLAPNAGVPTLAPNAGVPAVAPDAGVPSPIDPALPGAGPRLP